MWYLINRHRTPTGHPRSNQRNHCLPRTKQKPNFHAAQRHNSDAGLMYRYISQPWGLMIFLIIRSFIYLFETGAAPQWCGIRWIDSARSIRIWNIKHCNASSDHIPIQSCMTIKGEKETQRASSFDATQSMAKKQQQRSIHKNVPDGGHNSTY